MVPKNVWLKYQVYENEKLSNKFCQICYAKKSLKNNFLWFM